jgi:hypothetical protein
MHKLTDGHGRTLFTASATEARAIAAAYPQPAQTLPAAEVLEAEPLEPDNGPRMLALAICLSLMMLVLIGSTVAFFLFGEDRGRTTPEPALTAQERANCLRR